MVNEVFLTPFEMSKHIAKAVREKRLVMNLSQQSLSRNSGVSFAVIKKFELSGKISLESLLKLSLALGNLEDFAALFQENIPSTTMKISQVSALSLKKLLNQKVRKRGRK
jgi:transcriptional regulator with XRE-family HTH domain